MLEKGEMRSGRWVQFGLCVGSSDFIGIKTIIVKPEDVGKKNWNILRF